MAVQQQISAAHIDSNQETSILYRPSTQAGASWEIVREPVQRRMSQSPIVNLGSGGNCSCVLAGTPILMADGTTRAVETFVGGEKVRNLGGVGTVVAIDRPTLGVTRRIIELINARGESLLISDEHSLWTRFGEGEQAKEWWGTYNFSHYFMERSLGNGLMTTRDAEPLRFDLPNQHATIDGWHSVQPIYHVMSPDTPIYHLIVDVGGSYIAGGFLISSHATDADCEGARWDAAALVSA
ncbi:hypothetical protein [Trinickia fusca]|uniref:Hint domain-containing protein n=1 Tax=Trinickia fusca TaxID=2419777 RepID=A0A494XCS8_9BURK|nr:hypothetical protein [Trinickia fusca]RKP48430.1 hypothetical protein D7S89_14085 [Trinickia fusca]